VRGMCEGPSSPPKLWAHTDPAISAAAWSSQNGMSISRSASSRRQMLSRLFPLAGLHARAYLGEGCSGDERTHAELAARARPPVIAVRALRQQKDRDGMRFSL